MLRRWPATFLCRSRVGRLALTQGMKRSPLNLRPFLDVPKTRNSKTLALGLHAAVLMNDWPTDSASPISEAEHLIVGLQNTAIETANGIGWGYPFDWQSRECYRPRETPTAVCTAFVVRSLDLALQVPELARVHATSVRGAIAAAARFVARDLHRTGAEDRFCFSYSTVDHSRVVNATLLAAEVLARDMRSGGHDRYLSEVLATLRWVFSQRREDGGWRYGLASCQEWEDGFHTGFNLQCLLNIGTILEGISPEVSLLIDRNSLREGCEYYWDNFFDGDGRPWYYRDTPWPIDAHAGAVGIITLLAFWPGVPSNLDRARRVLDWMNANMWVRRGFYAFQKKRTHRITVPYIRWAQAWMLLALASERYAATHGDALPI